MTTWEEINQKLDPLNTKKAVFRSPNSLNIPIVRKSQLLVKRLLKFGKDRKGTVHFYDNPDTAESVWNLPKRYTKTVQKYESAITPVFPISDKFPNALNIWNIYRSRWCGAYWQVKGIPVIPAVFWAGFDSYWYAFEGLEEGSIVSVAWLANQTADQFNRGFKEMVRRIEPEEIILYGKLPPGLEYEVNHFMDFEVV